MSELDHRCQTLFQRLRNAFSVCPHKWETLDTYSINRSLDGKRVGSLYVLRCAHCGDIKRKRV